jgi:3-hydroxybutyryl-CoA dehydrogenase
MSAHIDKAAEWLLNQGQPGSQIVGVIGAGTMGAGIAQVAAASGHPVMLMDARPGAAAQACERIGAALDGLVDKGRMTAQERNALLARIEPVDRIEQLKDAALVIEAIVEDLQAKQALLHELEAQVSRDAILASNTSSISITALANGMRHPDRVVGMHFFNPVPLMKLVEVVSGAETAASAASAVYDTAGKWGKTPVQAKSTPGFIVNRIARPYYAEALALLQEQAGTPAELDALARGAGFRMGPCELMDLIGHDINYSVTLSVFEANYGDRRYVPSLVQKALVDGGRLGRKTGKGFYDGAPAATPSMTAPPPLSARMTVVGEGTLAHRLDALLRERQVPLDRDAARSWTGLRIDDVELHVTDGRSANQLAAQHATRKIGVIDLPLLAGKNAELALAFADSVTAAERSTVMEALAACKLAPVELRDVPGLLVARTVVMLINEGADAVYQGVCDEKDADLAMKLGTNYPAGPFEWLQQIGVDYCVTVLDHLHAAYRSERYRVSPLLRQRYWAAKIPI